MGAATGVRKKGVRSPEPRWLVRKRQLSSEPRWLIRLERRHQRPHLGKAIWELANTLIPFVVLWVVMPWMLNTGHPYWQITPLLLVTSGLMVRLFIIFHDCCHSSFVASRRWNLIVGFITGLLIFTPLEWGKEHWAHHATAQDLDKQGRGDIWTMTVREYQEADNWKRLGYRIYRNPFVLFVIVPSVMFLVIHRFAYKQSTEKGHRNVKLTNRVLFWVICLACLVMGWRTYLLIQLPAIALAGTFGVWLFYVQHQFEKDYFARHKVWDPIRAALEGSSYYKLPKVLQWFSGNIGFHHIHHLKPRIPFYNLPAAHNDRRIPEVRNTKTLTLRSSLKCIFLQLWDEEGRRMVSV